MAKLFFNILADFMTKIARICAMMPSKWNTYELDHYNSKNEGNYEVLNIR